MSRRRGGDVDLNACPISAQPDDYDFEIRGTAYLPLLIATRWCKELGGRGEQRADATESHAKRKELQRRGGLGGL